MGIIYSPVILNGQILSSGGTPWGWPTAVAGYVAQYQTVYNAFNTKPEAAVATAQNTMVTALDASGYWDRMDLFYVFANNASDNALINWKNPGTFNADNPTATPFISYEGFTGNGTSMYISTNWNASMNSVNYTQNSATIGAYSRTIDAADGNFPLFAAINTGDSEKRITLYPLQGGYMTSRINSASSSQLVAVNTQTHGLFTVTRRASNDVQHYINSGSSAQSALEPSNIPPNAELYFLYYANGPYYGNTQISCGFVMNGITTVDVSIIYNTIQTYMTAIGKQV